MSTGYSTLAGAVLHRSQVLIAHLLEVARRRGFFMLFLSAGTLAQERLETWGETGRDGGEKCLVSVCSEYYSTGVQATVHCHIVGNSV